MLTLVHDTDVHTHATPEPPVATTTVNLDDLCRLAAQQMLAVALEAERRAYVTVEHKPGAMSRIELGRALDHVIDRHVGAALSRTDRIASVVMATLR